MYVNNDLTLYDTNVVTEDGKGEKLDIGEDYTVTYSKNINAGTAKEGEAPTVETSFKLYDKKASNVFEIAEIAPQTYTGKAVEPKLVVKVKGTEQVLTEGVDYSVSYSKNINKGKAKATVTGIGNGYGGTKTATFNIVAADMQWDDDSVITTAIGKILSDMFN